VSAPQGCGFLNHPAADTATACARSPGYAIAGGRYLTLAPPGWDGKTALPVLVFFQVWRECAEYVVQDPSLRALVEKHGVLLIAPHGEGNTWSYPGAPGKRRDEFAFMAALVADVKARFPVDAHRFVAAGLSQGASVVLNSACRQPGLFTIHGALAGGFWEPSPEARSGTPVDLVHCPRHTRRHGAHRRACLARRVVQTGRHPARLGRVAQGQCLPGAAKRRIFEVGAHLPSLVGLCAARPAAVLHP